MRKTIAILLTLALMAGLFVIPAAAAENALCPDCNSGNYNSRGYEVVDSSYTVSSCTYYSGSHTHVDYTFEYYYVCSECGYRKYRYTSSSISRTFCGASNMNLSAIDLIY